MASSSEQPPQPPSRCWADLPPDVLWPVFTALGQPEVLSGGAGITCAAWWRFARDEPALWRRIDLTSPAAAADDTKEDYGMELSDDDDLDGGTRVYRESDEFSEDEQDMLSLFDDYDLGIPIYDKDKIAGKDYHRVDDDGDLSGDGILLGLFDDTSLDREEIPVKNGGTVEEELSDDESMLGLFDDPPLIKEDIPAKNDGTMEDDDDEEDLGDDESSLGLFDDLPIDKEKIPMKGNDMVEDDDKGLGEESLLDDALIGKENIPAMDDNMMDDCDDDNDDDGGEDDDGDVGLNDESLFDNSTSCEEEIPTNDSSRWKAMALVAIDRSAGQCEAFWGHADDEVLLYLADRAPSMKSFRVTLHSDVSSQVFDELIKKFPLLEELQLVLKSDAYDYTSTSGQPSTNSWVLELFQAACEACSHLHQFTVRRAGKERRSYSSRYQTERRSPTTLSIPMMHGLHSLEVFGDSFTRDVVMQIVDKCPNLECLDISDVPLDRWDIPVLTHKCSVIKDVKLPAVSYYYYSDDSYDDMS